MKKEAFCEVLGDIREYYVKAAHMTPRRKIAGWHKWGTMAACLCLLFAGAFALWSSQNNADNNPHEDNFVTSSGIPDVAPMVYVCDTLYKQSLEYISYPELKEEFIYIGKVETDITSDQSTATDGVPKENFQANTPIEGAEIYRYGDDIVVFFDGAYWLYTVLEDHVNSNAWDDLSEEEKKQSDPAYRP